MGCVPGILKKGTWSIEASGKRPIQVGKRPIKQSTNQATLDPLSQNRSSNTPAALCFSGYCKLSLLEQLDLFLPAKMALSQQRGSARGGVSYFIQVSSGHRGYHTRLDRKS